MNFLAGLLVGFVAGCAVCDIGATADKESRSNRKMQIQFKRLSDKATIPMRGSRYAAGYDLFVADGGGISPGETVMFHTDLAISIPNGYFGAIFARSGLSSKQGLRPATCVSVIDSDYTGEIGLPIHNDSKECRYINAGERVAQIIILPCQNIEWIEVDRLTETERGIGGYGSTGMR